MPLDRVNVLFTSAGRRVELLSAFRRALDSLGLAGNLAATDIDPLAPALQRADRPFIVPRTTSPDFVPAVARICRQEKIDLVFPLTDPDIPVLAAHRREIETSGARLVLVDQEAVEHTTDKWRTNRFFRGLGLATADCWLPEGFDAERASYPLFIKPRQGSASAHTHKIENAEELAFFLPRVPDPVIEEFIPGPEVTNDVIYSLAGNPLTVVSRQRIEVRWGEVHKGVTVSIPEVTQGCLEVAKGLKAVGPITVQCILRDGQPHFTEVNARYGGGCPLGIAAGADSPRWLLAEAAGLPVEVPPLGSHRTGLYLTRYDQSFFISEDQRAGMADHRP